MSSGKSADQKTETAGRPRGNGLDGATWTRYSISVWSDLRKSSGEAALRHPAMFPAALPARLIDCFTRPGPGLVIDPFAGTGSTPLAAFLRGKEGLGVELSPDFLARANARYEKLRAEGNSQESLPGGSFRMEEGDARQLERFVVASSAQLCVTSPPYWNILNQKRSADQKPVRDYGPAAADLGKIPGYPAFLDSLQEVFGKVFTALQPGGYCCAVVMDLRKGRQFYPFHSDLAARLVECGFIYDDLIIWDRRQEYNNLRPLGYPSVFRINKVHEFIIVARKPALALTSPPSPPPSRSPRNRSRTAPPPARVSRSSAHKP